MKTQFFFNDLTETQKQKLADRLIDDHPTRLNNRIVEYILNQDDYENAPFTREDITNFDYYGSVEINGYWEELTEEERDEKVEFFEHLKSRIDLVVDNLNNKIIDLEVDQLGEDDETYTTLQAKIDQLNKRIEKAEDKQYKLDKHIDDLNNMDFDEQPEIFQWFSCSDYLIRKLKEYGQCTLDNEFWGRQCCGQSITLDHVIQKIAFDYACDYGKDYLTLEQVKDL